LADGCFDFVRGSTSDFVMGISPFPDNPEHYLQLRAVVSFYLKDYETAAKVAGILGNVYFASAQYERDWHSVHFNSLAGMAYEKLGDSEKACHHFKQFLDGNSPHGKPKADEEYAKNYLASNKGHSSVVDDNSYDGKMKRRNDSAVTAARDMNAFVRQFKFDPVEHEYQNLEDAIDHLKAMKDLCERRFKALTNESADSESVGYICNEYDYGRFLDHLSNDISMLDEKLISEMSLADIHKLFSFDPYGFGYSSIRVLFEKYPDLISAKIKSVEDFLSFALYDNFAPFGEILLDKTTGSERARLYAMIAPEIDNIKSVEGSGISEYNVNDVREEAGIKTVAVKPNPQPFSTQGFTTFTPAVGRFDVLDQQRDVVNVPKL